jgi:hypothetical protein
MFRQYSIIAEGSGICNYFVEFAGGNAADSSWSQLLNG